MFPYHPKHYFLVSIVLCCSLVSFGQTPVFDYYNLGQGKQTLSVQSIAQDDRHHMYFGTDEGLIHYNGIGYQKITLNDTIAKQSITSLAFSTGKLWVGTSKGQLYSLLSDETQSVDLDTAITSAPITSIETFNDKLYIGTYGDGVYIITSKGIEHLNTTNGLGDDYTYEITFHRDAAWIGTDAGITVYLAEDQTTNVISMKDGLPDNIVKSIIVGRNGNLFIGTHEAGVFEMNTADLSFEPLQPEGTSWDHGPVESMVLDDNGALWIATKRRGLVCANFDDAHTMIRAFSEINGLGSNRTHILFEDAEHNLWIGTYKGVSLYRGSTFEYLTPADGLIGSNVYDLLLDKDGNYWISTEKGVIKFTYNELGQGLIERITESNGFLGNQVVSMYEDNAGNIWMGSYGAGLFLYDKVKNKLITFDEKDGLENTNVLDITQDQQGRIWLATLGGAVAYVEPKDDGYHIAHLNDSEHLTSNYIYAVYLDDDNQLWIGSDGAGVAVYNCTENYFKPKPEGEIVDATVYAITQSGDGALWLATAESGVYRLSKGAMRNFNEADGLRNTSVVGIAAGNNGEVIAVHSMGIDVLFPEEDRFSPFNVDKEAFNFEPNLNAISTSDAGVLIGTESGAVKFSNDIDEVNNLTPHVTLSNLRVLYERLPMRQDASFDNDENHFIFDYLAIWMKAPEAIRYKYILEGFDKKWSFETESRVATYSSLPPGNYTFKVTASADGVHWSDPAASSYSFVILKPIWMQWWFYLSIFIVLGTFIFIFVRWRTRKLIEDKLYLEEVVAERTEELRLQKSIIETKNDEILSSISYARRIQKAILPPSRQLQDALPKSFVLYKPKDIVAGDFYWLENLDDRIVFAAADCTGHGVPGAMVSVVCHNALNRAVREFKLTKPSEILNKVMELVIDQFSKSEDEVKDGMDIALCSYDPASLLLEFAGAHNPLWLVSEREEKACEQAKPAFSCETEGANGYFLHEVKADKQPIGKYMDPKPFTNHSVQLQPGDSFYLFSDGYADQFGGPRSKKFKYKSLKELVLSIQNKSMVEQRDVLNQVFEEWRGNLEQIDDVCVIGVRV